MWNHCQKPARPTYSRIRTGILNLTPEDSKCRLYCKGNSCKYCVPRASDCLKEDIPGLYSTWITENILAMSRLCSVHFNEFRIIEQFKGMRINTVINLEEIGEHAFCGEGVTSSGFSYDPEELMRNNIFYFNFPIKDFGACSPQHLLDIAKVAGNSLKDGRIAVHCHAGHGRTGMVIAAILMYLNGYSANYAVQIVRNKRSQSVQSNDQVTVLNRFEKQLNHSFAKVIPLQKLSSITEYIEYSANYLSPLECRLYGYIPQPIYICCLLILKYFYDSVSLDIDFQKRGAECFTFTTTKPRHILLEYEDIERIMDKETKDIGDWYERMCENGMNLVNFQHFMEEDSTIRIRFGFLIHFFQSIFHQITTKEELEKYVKGAESAKHPEWCWLLWLFISLCRSLPVKLQPDCSDLIMYIFTKCSNRDGLQSIYKKEKSL